MMGEFPDPAELRRQIRARRFESPTTGQAGGFLQANLSILPRALASDFLAFCVKNPKPCPLIGVSQAGARRIPALGDDLDVATDVPFYRVFRDGERHDRIADLLPFWRDDLVTFAIGCSFSFEESCSAPASRCATSRRAGTSRCMSPASRPRRQVPSAVRWSSRCAPFDHPDAIKAIVLSDRQPLAHGAPVHIGDPAADRHRRPRQRRISATRR
jgi:uncharacterized protein YcsI (UPF0317 family)